MRPKHKAKPKWAIGLAGTFQPPDAVDYGVLTGASHVLITATLLALDERILFNLGLKLVQHHIVSPIKTSDWSL
jgi:hypothetical protein